MFRQEELTLKSKIYLFVFIVFSSIATCGSVKVRVGEKAQLDFPYPCNSAVVTLQRSNARPFYRSADPQYMSLSSNQDLVNDTETGLNQCFLNLTINPVSRADEGTYILTAYKNGAMLPDYPRIYLGVVSPPGKTSCESGNEYVDGEWIELHCTASLGWSQDGQIVCYQGGLTLTPTILKRDRVNQVLKQNIMANLHVQGLVYCCSSFVEHIKHKCECKDWVWEPNKTTELADIPDPCPDTSTMQSLLPTPVSIIESENFTSVSFTEQIPSTKKIIQKNNLALVVTCTILLSIIIFSLVIFINAYIRNRRLQARERTENTPSISVNEEQVEDLMSETCVTTI